MRIWAKTYLCVLLLACSSNYVAFAADKIIIKKVAPGEKGAYQTIQEAINSVPEQNQIPVRIDIRNGRYEEKLWIRKSHIQLKGESREQTIIVQSIARDEWRCSHPTDWGVATINVDSCTDLSFDNLTVINEYGKVNNTERKVACPLDTAGSKVIRTQGHQMAFRSFSATRLSFRHCRFVAYGGDTMSPWNTFDGMFYFDDCIMEGGVDLYCPRGWAYAENCRFVANGGDAIIWHDGSGATGQKTVLKNCRFEGYDGFRLGRYHRDAQFFLINCVFASNMADKEIYRVPTSNQIQWGHRIYYYNCSQENKAPAAWYKNNLTEASEKMDPLSLGPDWVFGLRWNPVQAAKAE